MFQITFTDTDLIEAEQVQAGLADLTKREEEVLRLVMEGRSSPEIAAKLGIGIRTAEVHRTRIMDKLGAKRSVDLVRMILVDQLVLSLRAFSLPASALYTRRRSRRRLSARGRRASRLQRAGVID